MKKFIIANFLIGSLILSIPPYRATYVAEKPPEDAHISVKTPPRKVLKRKVVKYAPPTGKVAEIANLVAKETGYDVEIVNKIMFAESHYDINAKHINKNGSVDSGLFQINSIHTPVAQKMGIDIHTPEGNAQFAIYLIKRNGLRDWGYSKSTWEKL